MRFLYICYAVLIVTGATMLNYRQANGWNTDSYNSSSGSGSRLGSGTFGSSHK
jgi:hypothetical protein